MEKLNTDGLELTARHIRESLTMFWEIMKTASPSEVTKACQWAQKIIR